MLLDLRSLLGGVVAALGGGGPRYPDSIRWIGSGDTRRWVFRVDEPDEILVLAAALGISPEGLLAATEGGDLVSL